MAHPNEELLRRGYGAFAKRGPGHGHVDLRREHRLASPGRGHLAGDFKGREQVREFFAKLSQLSGGTFRIEMHDILADDEHVVPCSKSGQSAQARRSTLPCATCGT
ncbi:MAG TPA: nuclear transport factor 2 family protein [Acidimicrobiales bacterium]|nr:nuclear transport factor 2 family protein [Acidimicrobiales bacterium]